MSELEAAQTVIKGMAKAASDLKKSFFGVVLGSCRPAMKAVQKVLGLI